MYFNNLHHKSSATNRDHVRISSTNGLENEERVTYINDKIKRQGFEPTQRDHHLFRASSTINLRPDLVTSFPV